jgi:hypothetical protein
MKVGLPEENTPHTRTTMTQIINNYFGTANTHNFIYCSTIVSCATAIIIAYCQLICDSLTHLLYYTKYSHSTPQPHLPGIS